MMCGQNYDSTETKYVEHVMLLTAKSTTNLKHLSMVEVIFEPRHEKTNNVDSDQV